MNESVKWLKWQVPATIPEKTAATPNHKPQQQQQQQQQAGSPQIELSLDPHLKPVAETAADIKKYQAENNNDSYTEPFERMLQPHIGMNPFLNGNTYLNDIVVQNTMLRGEGGRRL
jgi:hypothetical protein